MSAMREVGPLLERYHYRIVPERNRVPLVGKWTQGEYRYQPEHAECDVGVVCGVDAQVGAIDVDCDDEPVSKALELMLRTLSGFDDMPVRVGRAPRFLVPVYCEEVMRSAASSQWTSTTGKTCRVEFLGQGRKWTGYGTHSKTGKPYTWRGGIAPHQGRAPNMLPWVNTSLVKQVLGQVDAYLQGQGWTQGSGARQAAAATSVSDGPSMLGLAPKVGLTLERATQALATLDLAQREDWVNAGMAVHHEFDGSAEAFDAWHARSAECAGYAGEKDCRVVWQSFQEDRDAAPITARWLLSQEKAAMKEALVLPAPVPKPGKVGEFEKITARELVARQHQVDWLVKGVIPRGGLGMVFGASGVGKSFFVTDLALHIASGLQWRGLRTKPGNVVYIVAEGQGGFGARVSVWARTADVALDDINAEFITRTPNMLSTDSDKLREAIGQADLVIVDTVAATTPGANENSGEEMGLFLGQVRGIAEECNAAVLLVHHAGKDKERGARGWSGLRAAVDFEIEVSREQQAPERQARLTKSRDGQDGLEWWFRLDVLEVGQDADGEPVTSCLALPADAPPPVIKAPKEKALGGWEEAAWYTLLAAMDAKNQAPYHEVFTAALRYEWQMPEEAPATHSGGRDVRKQNLRRAFGNLEKRGWVVAHWQDGSVGTLEVVGSPQ
ncbi:Primase, C-terminal 2 [uncultured Caudovirales phage]|uniref:Primase, C-terminal 2 n=1 Tax=uncultured Caudovirales phage TaxID=2100421 RepID=A0A6J5P1I1_9CAUD|nr:Primase, C-terminal 2 [uncultured Caudovirales phage]